MTAAHVPTAETAPTMFEAGQKAAIRAAIARPKRSLFGDLDEIDSDKAVTAITKHAGLFMIIAEDMKRFGLPYESYERRARRISACAASIRWHALAQVVPWAELLGVFKELVTATDWYDGQRNAVRPNCDAKSARRIRRMSADLRDLAARYMTFPGLQGWQLDMLRNLLDAVIAGGEGSPCKRGRAMPQRPDKSADPVVRFAVSYLGQNLRRWTKGPTHAAVADIVAALLESDIDGRQVGKILASAP